MNYSLDCEVEIHSNGIPLNSTVTKNPDKTIELENVTNIRAVEHESYYTENGEDIYSPPNLRVTANNIEHQFDNALLSVNPNTISLSTCIFYETSSQYGHNSSSIQQDYLYSCLDYYTSSEQWSEFSDHREKKHTIQRIASNGDLHITPYTSDPSFCMINSDGHVIDKYQMDRFTSNLDKSKRKPSDLMTVTTDSSTYNNIGFIHSEGHLTFSISSQTGVKEVTNGVQSVENKRFITYIEREQDSRLKEKHVEIIYNVAGYNYDSGKNTYIFTIIHPNGTLSVANYKNTDDITIKVYDTYHNRMISEESIQELSELHTETSDLRHTSHEMKKHAFNNLNIPKEDFIMIMSELNRDDGVLNPEYTDEDYMELVECNRNLKHVIHFAIKYNMASTLRHTSYEFTEEERENLMNVSLSGDIDVLDISENGCIAL